MSFRNLVIENPAKISIRNSQLVVVTDREHSLPIEDLSSILIESRQSVITLAALSELAQNNCTVYVCDSKHMPCAILEPYFQSSRHLNIIKAQIEATEPFKKRLWQDIVKHKIHNQTVCLQLNQCNSEFLFTLEKSVRSGDPDNHESTAARCYFPLLFGKGFSRNEENGINACLNYGYSIIRGCVARCLAVSRLQPPLGIHHHNDLNAFNLADDLMEAYRPVIDLMVATEALCKEGLTKENKRYILGCLTMNILIGERHFSVNNAIEKTVQSFAKSVTEKHNDMLLPFLLPLEPHRLL